MSSVSEINNASLEEVVVCDDSIDYDQSTVTPIDKLNTSYLDYYKSVQKIVKYIKDVVQKKEQYTYKEHKAFAETIIKLIGDLVDDYMSGQFSLWSKAATGGDRQQSSLSLSFLQLQNSVLHLQQQVGVGADTVDDQSGDSNTIVSAYDELLLALDNTLSNETVECSGLAENKNEQELTK
nr:hp [Calliteara abietis nucleopolyhedrovirus]